jgi:hypothetical protein
MNEMEGGSFILTSKLFASAVAMDDLFSFQETRGWTFSCKNRFKHLATPNFTQNLNEQHRHLT